MAKNKQTNKNAIIKHAVNQSRTSQQQIKQQKQIQNNLRAQAGGLVLQ